VIMGAYDDFRFVPAEFEKLLLVGSGVDQRSDFIINQYGITVRVPPVARTRDKNNVSEFFHLSPVKLENGYYQNKFAPSRNVLFAPKIGISP